MNCIVTAGPTFEPLDDVRRLTNFSTGNLGTDLAAYLSSQGHHVVLLRGYYAVHPLPGLPASAKVIPFTTTANLADHFRKLSADAFGAVFHAAAVSDFAFGKVYSRTPAGDLQPVTAGKFSTRQGTLLAELLPTTKILPQLRSWFGNARLVGWKFEVDGGRPDAIAAGAAQLRQCQTDGCVVNGPAYGEGFGWINRSGDTRHLADQAALFRELGALLR